jgi:hypothetical protein
MSVTSLMTAAALLAVPGCTASSRPGLGQGLGRIWNQTFHGHVHQDEEIEIPVMGVTDVEVDNFAGHVRIVRCRASSQPTMSITRRGTHGMGRGDAASDSMDEIAVDYFVETDGERQRFVVRAKTDHLEPWFQAVDIDIRLERVGIVVVRTKDGHVEVVDFEDGVDIESSNGDVRVSTRAALKQPSTILNQDGSIAWRVGPHASGLFDAEAVHGTIRTDVLKGKWNSSRSGNDLDSLHAQLNGGTARIALRTVDGNISVYVGEHPTEYGTFVR